MIREIARREITVRIRSRTWRIVSVLLVLIVIGGVVLVSVLDGTGDDTSLERIGVTVALSPDVDPALRDVLNDPTRSRFDFTFVESTGDLATDLEEAALVIEPDQLDWPGVVDAELSFVVQSAIAELDVLARGEALGLDPAEVTSLLTPTPVGERIVDDPGSADDVGAGVGVLATILTFIGIQAYGSLVVLGVVEEKSSRVVEVLLSHVRARDLLAGKILGIAALAVIQLLIVLAGALVALVATDSVDVSASTLAAVPLVAVTFVLGFLFYAVVFALGGSLVSRQEDAQQIMLPIMVPLFAGYLLGFSTAASPDSLLARVTALVPFTSPFVLPVRFASGEAALWEVGVAIALLVVAAWVAWTLAARVYEFTLLRMGSRIPLRDVLRLARAQR